MTELVQQPLPYSEQAANIIRSAVLRGQYQLGERLNEVELSATLRISRSPIREALRQLAQEGLVRLVSGRGAFVASFTPDEVRDLLELREPLDVLAARLAAERATDAELDRLGQILTDVTAALSGEDEPPHGESPGALDFHIAIYEASGNRRLLEHGRSVHGLLRLARFRSGASSGRPQAAHREHLEVLGALRDRDPAAAGERMRQHLAMARDRILDVVEPTG